MPATTRKISRKRGGSREESGSGHSRRRRVVATSIPELKRSFDALESEVGKILRNPNEAQRIRQFQEAWRRIFGRPVEPVAASAYLQVKSRDKGRGKSRKAQKGGMMGGSAALAGAPLDFQTRPGVDGVHGSFPPYITQGFGFYNTVNQEGLAKDCGVVDITPKVPADLGSNEFQKGGGVLSDAISAVMARPAGSASPPGLLDEIQASWKGRDMSASPSPDQNPLKYR